MEFAGRRGDIPGESDDWYRTTNLPLYGLPPSYKGPRMLGDSMHGATEQADGSVLLVQESYGLGHGNPISGPWLEVITSNLPPLTVHELLQTQRGSEPGDCGSPLTEVRIDVLIDGEPITFKGVECCDVWVVQARVGAYAVSIVGVQWMARDGLALVRIRDVEAYSVGRNDFIRRLREERPRNSF